MEVEKKDRKNGLVKKSKRKKEIFAMARTSGNASSSDLMMIDSSTTLHITPFGKKVSSVWSCNVNIALGDDSKTRAYRQGARRVQRNGEDGPVFVTFFNTLVAQGVSLSLLSFPVPVQKGLEVLFVPERAFIINMKDGKNVVGYAYKGPDGLFYIGDDG